MPLRSMLNASVRTKVLVTVISCMAVLIATAMFVVNQRVTRQFEQQAQEILATADAEFRHLQKARAEDLLLRFRNLPNEPRYRAAFQLGDPPTLHQPLMDLLGEHGADVVFYSANPLKVLASEKRDPLLPVGAFETVAAPATQQALEGQPTVDTVYAGGRLFNVIAIPVYVDRELIGALALGLEIGNNEAQKFSRLTQSQLVLLADGKAVAWTLPGATVKPEVLDIYKHSTVDSGTFSPAGIQRILLDEQHYFGMAGRFESLTRNKSLGYVLLASYEQPLQSLKKTQQLLLTASLGAIVIGAAVAWWVIRRITQPLRDLRDSVEAVGRGDLSRRVEIQWEDECGELARVYNQMAENLKSSKEQLEKTHAELVESSRLAGMAEVASGVLHNVGNVLTSINIASSLISEGLKNSKTGNLSKVVALFREHESNLGNFLTQDPKGRQAVEYLKHLSQHLIKEQESVIKELAQIQSHISHIENIVRAQQNFSRLSSGVETLRVADVVQDALNMSLTTKGGLQVVKEISGDLTVTVEKHKVLQILVNLIRNAKQACDSSTADQKLLTVRASSDAGKVCIAVTDNGSGIDPQNLGRIFSRGFTTKKEGHGFGLHNSAATARQLGGELRVNSDGAGKGATFTLELPSKPSNGK